MNTSVEQALMSKIRTLSPQQLAESMSECCSLSC